MVASMPWSGAVTTTGGTVSVRSTAGSARLAVSTASDLSSPSYSPSAAPANGRVKLAATGLAANTVYHYGVEEDGVLGARLGQFRTARLAGSSFSFGIASCKRNTSNHLIHDVIRAKNFDFFIQHGDFHYADNTDGLLSTNLASYEAQFTARFSALLASLSMPHIYDDHEWGGVGGNGDRTTANGPGCAAAYGVICPHYPLPVAGCAYQTFTWGRIRFILLDERPFRDPDTDPDTASKTFLGAAQKAQLKADLSAAAAAGLVPVVISPSVWKTEPGDRFTTDSLGLFTHERTEIEDYWVANNCAPIGGIICGDAHACDYDDGSHNDHSTGGASLRVPVAIASAMDQDGGSKGDVWSGGQFDCKTPNGQYMQVDVIDNGTNITIRWTGFRVDNTGVESRLWERAFIPGLAAGNTPWVPARVRRWDGTAWVQAPATAAARYRVA